MDLCESFAPAYEGDMLIDGEAFPSKVIPLDNGVIDFESLTDMCQASSPMHPVERATTPPTVEAHGAAPSTPKGDRAESVITSATSAAPSSVTPSTSAATPTAAEEDAIAATASSTRDAMVRYMPIFAFVCCACV